MKNWAERFATLKNGIQMYITLFYPLYNHFLSTTDTDTLLVPVKLAGLKIIKTTKIRIKMIDEPQENFPGASIMQVII